MEIARIAELLQPFCLEEGLTADHLNNISIYIDILLQWNARINLTSVRDPEQMVTRHFGESLFAGRSLLPRSQQAFQRVVDLGSGAGFPGLPLKLWAPEIHLTLIESNHKKATFLREVIRRLGLATADVFAGRAEDFPSATADLLTMRAVERFEDVVPSAAKLVRPGGCIALLIGESQAADAQELLPDFLWSHPVSIPNSTTRILLVAHCPTEL